MVEGAAVASVHDDERRNKSAALKEGKGGGGDSSTGDDLQDEIPGNKLTGLANNSLYFAPPLLLLFGSLLSAMG